MASTSWHLVHVLALLSVLQGAIAEPVYKVCLTSRRKQSWLCDDLAKAGYDVVCGAMSDSAECARLLQDGSVDFAALSAEEMFLASKFVAIDNTTSVIGEIRHEERLSESFAFKSVAVVKASFTGKLSDLKGKNLCHPGFADSQLWTDRVLKFFERSVVPPECNPKLSVLENEVAALDNFFNASCRPGPWVLSDWYDRELKKKHFGLCELCDQREGCAYDNQRFGSHKAALNCLAKNGGDVAYAALQYVLEYFGLMNYKAEAPADQFRLLCPNGTVQRLDSKQPCAWVQQPWGAFVARKEIANDLRKKLNEWLRSSNTRAKASLQEYLSKIIGEKNNFVDASIPDGGLSMSAYLRRGHIDIATPLPSAKCKRSVKWCVSNRMEVEKCDWLRQGALSYGLEPAIECINEHSILPGCLRAVQSGQAHIVGIDADYSYIARQSFGLNPLIYQDTSKEGSYNVLAVVRADSDIKKLGDLKKRKACFPEYGSVAWTAWVDAARSLKLLPRRCPSSAAVGEYFLKTCAPGANFPEHNPKGDGKVPLCSACPPETDPAKKCAADSSNIYYGNQGAMRCLMERGGDVAFVDLRGISETVNGVPQLLEQYRDEEYRVLCRNGSVTSMTGLFVDSGCSLATGIGGEIVTTSIDTVESRDAALLLLDLENWFGTSHVNSESAFDMFASFKNISGVMFRPFAEGFVSIFNRQHQAAEDFSSLMNRNKGCNLDGSGAGNLSSASALALLALGAFVAARNAN